MEKTFQYYATDGSMILLNNGDCWCLSPEEVVAWDRIKHQKIEINELELLQIFSTAEKIVRRRIKDLEKDKRKFLELNNVIKDVCYKNIKNIIDRDKVEKFLLSEFYDEGLKKITAKIDNYNRMLLFAKRDGPPQYKDSIDVKKVKQVPIKTLIKFNQSGFAKCIFHDEKTPSMKYYEKENRVNCFSCGKNGDVIDVMMQLNHCSFKEALKKLSGL